MKNNGRIPLTFGQSELRRRQVSRLNANMRLEGFTPDTSDLVIQAKYVRGAATLEDLFDHAIELARKSEVQAEMIGYMVGDMDEGAAAAAHLESGQPITYADDNFPGLMVREWPDGRCELIGVDLVTGKVIVVCDTVPDISCERSVITMTGKQICRCETTKGRDVC